MNVAWGTTTVERDHARHNNKGRGSMTEEELRAIEERCINGEITYSDVAAMATEIRRLWAVNAEIRRVIGYKSKGLI